VTQGVARFVSNSRDSLLVINILIIVSVN